jgi:hypothetical protein
MEHEQHAEEAKAQNEQAQAEKAEKEITAQEKKVKTMFFSIYKVLSWSLLSWSNGFLSLFTFNNSNAMESSL